MMKPIKELEFERVYDAPVDVVWSAWTDPEKIRQWWGPDNVTIRECELELRVGGRFYVVMEAGEGMGSYKGTRWPMEGTLTAVQPKVKLAYTANAWTEGQKEDTHIGQTTEIAFSDQSGKTHIHVKATINELGPKAGMAVQGMQYGYNQQLEKLSNFLVGNR
jgi:uncharacterized protein YndB with AHSA1/START domain